MTTWSDYDWKNPPPVPEMEVCPGPVNTHPGPDFAPKEKEPEASHEWQGVEDRPVPYILTPRAEALLAGTEATPGLAAEPEAGS